MSVESRLKLAREKYFVYKWDILKSIIAYNDELKNILTLVQKTYWVFTAGFFLSK